MKKNFLTAFIILILASLTLSSCSRNQKFLRYDVSNFVSYMETPPEYTLGDVLPRQGDFLPLSKKEMKNLHKLLTNDDSFIWLKINFFLIYH